MHEDPFINKIDSKYKCIENLCQSPEQCNNIISKYNAIFPIYNMNIRSKKKNFDEFLITLKTLNISPDCIVLTETQASYCTNYTIPGYNNFVTKIEINKSSSVSIFINEVCKVVNISELPPKGANFLQIDLNKNKNHQL